MSLNSQQHSYETMTSGSDENGKSTNPSSLNSSYDQLHMQHPHMRKQDNYSQPQRHPSYSQYDNEMNFAPVSPVSQHMPQYGHGNGYEGDYGNGSNGHYQQQPPPPPKDYYGNGGGGRMPISLNGPPSAPSSGAAGVPNALRKGDGNKRQSWLSRKFSRREK
jgi:hypothetical protein